MLTAEEIANKKFDTKMRGYNPAEVAAFMQEVASTVSQLADQNRELNEQVEANEEKLKYFTDLKDSLNKSILVAQEAADKVKGNAKKEAEIVVREAQKQATDIVSEANEKSNAVVESAASETRRLVAETNDLKKQTRIFRQRLQVMLESQLEVVKSDDWDQLLANDDLSQYEEMEKILSSRVDKVSNESVESTATIQPQAAASSDQADAEAASAEEPAEEPAGETVVVFPDAKD